jgi:PTH1 family peptidyl-tRNA hydrolase
MSSPATDFPSPEILVVGLGNPGPEYAETRHNVGWMAADEFAARAGIDLSRKRWHGRVGRGTVGAHHVWVLEPQTFMNLSGRSVKEARRDLELSLEQIWVVHDELDLPLGRLRIRIGGSAAGNNGIKSIIGSLGEGGFVRFRIGVDKPAHRGSASGVRHVLAPLRGPDRERAMVAIGGAAAALRTALEEGLDRAMNFYNRRNALD